MHLIGRDEPFPLDSYDETFVISFLEGRVGSLMEGKVGVLDTPLAAHYMSYIYILNVDTTIMNLEAIQHPLAKLHQSISCSLPLPTDSTTCSKINVFL